MLNQNNSPYTHNNYAPDAPNISTMPSTSTTSRTSTTYPTTPTMTTLNTAQSAPSNQSQPMGYQTQPVSTIKPSAGNHFRPNFGRSFFNGNLLKSKTILSVLGVLLASFIIYQVFIPKATITVVGEGKLTFTPDQVAMVVTRANAGVDPISVINEGDAGIKVLIDAAKSVGGDKTEVSKAFYQVQPMLTASGQNYQVANAFSLKFDDVNKANEMIKTLYSSGASTISNVNFSSSKTQKTNQEARKLAVKDAKDQASQIAKSAGKRLGRLMAISDDNLDVSGTVSNQASDQVDFSTVTVTKRVTLVFSIW